MNFCSKLMGRTLSALSMSTGNQEQMFSPTIKEKYLLHNLFVHHCKTFPNPLNVVMIPGSNPLKSFPQEAGSFYAVITQWCHGPNLREDYDDDRRDVQRVSCRKMWIPQTNQWEEWREIWLHFNLVLFAKVWIFTKFFHCKLSLCFL